jgi:hypothetical protein
MRLARHDLIATDHLHSMPPALQLLHPSLQPCSRVWLIHPVDAAVPMQLHVDAQLVGELAIQLDAAAREVVIAACRS